MNMLASIFTGLAGAIPIAIMTLFFKSKYTRIIGILIAIGCNIACVYMVIIKSALIGVNKSNEWGIAYFVGVL
jgi:hypothetical protein